MTKLFWVDPAHDFTVSYEDLHADLLNVAEKESQSSCESEISDGYRTCRELLTAVLRNRNLSLTSGPFGESFPAENDAGLAIDYLHCFEEDDLDWVECFEKSQARIVLQTSGTSSNQSKVVSYLPRQLIRGIQVSPEKRENTWGLTYPINRFAGLQVFLQAFLNQNTLVNLAGLAFGEIGQAIKDWRISHLSGTPTWYRMLAANQKVYPEVEQITFGGEILDKGTLANVKACFPNAAATNIYASTEAGTLLVSDSDVFRVPKQLRKKVIVKDDCLCIHQSLLAGFNVEQQDKSESIDEFFNSGDRVEVIAEDPLTFRIKMRDSDLIVVGGFNVNPHRVESELLAIPAVSDVRVYGQANSVTGNIVACDVVASDREEVDVASIRRVLSQCLEPYEIPRVINIVDEIPKTITGKKVRS